MRLLATNICVPLLNGGDPLLRDQLLSLAPQDVALCSIVKAELQFGARNSARVLENLQRLEVFVSAFESLPFDDLAAEHYGGLRVSLKRAGSPIGANDMLIAAIALAYRATLVTRNIGEFSRVPGLQIEEW